MKHKRLFSKCFSTDKAGSESRLCLATASFNITLCSTLISDSISSRSLVWLALVVTNRGRVGASGLRRRHATRAPPTVTEQARLPLCGSDSGCFPALQRTVRDFSSADSVYIWWLRLDSPTN